MNEGYQLKLKIKAIDKTQEQAATALGMTRQNLAILFNKNRLDEDFKQNVKDVLGIDIGNSNVLHEDQAPYFTPKDELITSLKETIASQKELIEILKERNAALERQVNGTAARKYA